MLTSNLICTHPECIICIKWSAILQFQPEICLLHIKKQYIPDDIPIYTHTYGYIPLHVYTYQYTRETYQYMYIHTNTHVCPNIRGPLSPLRAPWWATLVSCLFSVLWATLHQNLEGRRRRGSEWRRGMLPPTRQSAQKAWKCPLAVSLC